MDMSAEIDDRVWFELRAPRRAPERKGPYRGKAAVKFLRELMDARPGEFITVVTLGNYGEPIFTDGPECLIMMDGRQKARARRHMKTSAAAFASGSKP